MDDTKFMTDTLKIERAIAGLTEWQKHVQTGSDIDRDISVAVEVLKAQLDTDVPDTNVGDTISRQAAIDICNHAVESFTGQFGAGVLTAIRDDIEQLPSAETDIIRCEDCEYYGSRRWCELHSSVFDDNAFCSYGERRQDG